MALTKVKGSILSNELYRRENNLSDVLDKAIARNNLSVYAKSETYTKNESESLYLNESNNLSDLDNKSTARANLDVFSKSEINSELDKIPPSIWVGETRIFSFDTLPPGFFALDGSTIVNGKIDYVELANSGSRFITISGNDLILVDSPDFLRGKGSSNRSVGQYESDEFKEHWHPVYMSNNRSPGSYAGLGNGAGFSGPGVLATTGASSGVASSGGAETCPKSLTVFDCIYHGVI